MKNKDYVPKEGKMVHSNMTSIVKEPGVNFQGATHGDGAKHHGRHHGKHHKSGHKKHRYHDHHFMNH